jgi:hypothetical protein
MRQQLIGRAPGTIRLTIDVGGEAFEVAGASARELPKLTRGRLPVPDTAQLPRLEGRTYSALEDILGRPTQYQPDRQRITWHRPDGAMVQADVPGPGAIQGQVFELNREPHILKTLPVPYAPPGVPLAVSDTGVLVPLNSTPAHIPVTITHQDLAKVARYNLPTRPPPPPPPPAPKKIK